MLRKACATVSRLSTAGACDSNADAVADESLFVKRPKMDTCSGRTPHRPRKRGAGPQACRGTLKSDHPPHAVMRRVRPISDGPPPFLANRSAKASPTPPPIGKDQQSQSDRGDCGLPIAGSADPTLAIEFRGAVLPLLDRPARRAGSGSRRWLRQAGRSRRTP